MIPLTKPYITSDEINAVAEVLQSGWLVQGDRVKLFEEGISVFANVRYGCATTSCTTALQLAMLAEGMGPDMDVIVPSFTFVATANAVVSTGAHPVICDILEDTFNLDAQEVRTYIKENYIKSDGGWYHHGTKRKLWGIIPVHQFGLCADMTEFNNIRDEYGIHIIEDAACALGSRIGERHAGDFGNTSCFSFHPRKSITTGEGGITLTNEKEIVDKMISLRNHGSMIASKERHSSKQGTLPEFTEAGYNFRMTDIQAAIGCSQLKKLTEILESRQKIARNYNELLSGKEELIKTPFVPEGYYHSYQSYVCRIVAEGNKISQGEIRDRVMEQLAEQGIATRQGTHAVHKLAYYKERFAYSDNDIPVADRCDRTTISLPLYVGITKEEQKYVVDNLLLAIKEWLI